MPKNNVVPPPMGITAAWPCGRAFEIATRYQLAEFSARFLALPFPYPKTVYVKLLSGFLMTENEPASTPQNSAVAAVLFSAATNYVADCQARINESFLRDSPPNSQNNCVIFRRFFAVCGAMQPDGHDRINLRGRASCHKVRKPSILTEIYGPFSQKTVSFATVRMQINAGPDCG